MASQGPTGQTAFPTGTVMAETSGKTIQLLTIQELSTKCRLSIPTIHRLKRLSKIPYFQPAGKGGRVLFPADAIERASSETAEPSSPPTDATPHLSGPSPTWMRFQL